LTTENIRRAIGKIVKATNGLNVAREVFKERGVAVGA